MTAYDQDRLHAEIDALPDTALHNTAMGMRMQDLVSWLFSEVAGVEVAVENSITHDQSEEKDIWITHDARVSGLPFSDAEIPVECKNEAAKISSSEVRDFQAKVRNSGGSEGLMISREGLAGEAGTHAHAAVAAALGQGVRVTVIRAADLAVLETTEDLVQLIRARHSELRFQKTYISI